MTEFEAYLELEKTRLDREMSIGSRKFLITVGACLLATVLLLFKIITPLNWVDVFKYIIIAYLGVNSAVSIAGQFKPMPAILPPPVAPQMPIAPQMPMQVTEVKVIDRTGVTN